MRELKLPLLKKAVVYRAGSVLLAFGINFAIFRKLEIAIGLTILFTITHTWYYYLFHRLWP